MQTVQIPYDQDLKSVTQRLARSMDSIGCTTDSVQIFVNHWGRWVAKIVRRSDGHVFHAFGSDLLEALNGLESKIQAI